MLGTGFFCKFENISSTIAIIENLKHLYIKSLHKNVTEQNCFNAILLILFYPKGSILITELDSILDRLSLQFCSHPTYIMATWEELLVIIHCREHLGRD